MSRRTTQLTQMTDPIRGDLLYIVDDPAGTPASRSLQVENLLSGQPELLVAANGATDDAKRHADYICDGTADDVQIQAALDVAEAAGGGFVKLSPGVFVLASGLTVGQYVSLVGQGFNTQVDATGTTDDAITIASGTNYFLYSAEIAKIRITLPAASSGDGIVTTGLQGNNLKLSDIFIDGGDSGAWGITLERINKVVATRIYIGAVTGSDCNGLRITNAGNTAVNFGNITLIEVNVNLAEDNTTGFYVAGGTNGNINLIEFIRCQASALGGASGTVGFDFGNYAQHMALLHCDSENHDVGYQMGAGTSCGNYTVLGCFEFNCTTGMAVNKDAGLYLHVIGGNGDLDNWQSHLLARQPRVRVNTNTALSDTEVGKIMENEGQTGTTTITLTLPSAANALLYRYTITNVNATVSACQIKFQCAASDNLIDTDGTTPTNLTSNGDLGDSLTVQNINYKYWRVEDKIGTWS